MMMMLHKYDDDDDDDDAAGPLCFFALSVASSIPCQINLYLD